jgi:hypothetical protein
MHNFLKTDKNMLHFLFRKNIFNPKLNLDFFLRSQTVIYNEAYCILLDQGSSSPK